MQCTHTHRKTLPLVLVRNKKPPPPAPFRNHKSTTTPVQYSHSIRSTPHPSWTILVWPTVGHPIPGPSAPGTYPYPSPPLDFDTRYIEYQSSLLFVYISTSCSLLPIWPRLYTLHSQHPKIPPLSKIVYPYNMRRTRSAYLVRIVCSVALNHMQIPKALTP